VDPTPPSEYPFFHPFPPDCAPSEASEVLPLPKRHRWLQQTCSAPHPFSGRTKALQPPPSPTRCPCLRPHAARRHPAAMAASSRVLTLPPSVAPKKSCATSCAASDAASFTCLSVLHVPPKGGCWGQCYGKLLHSSRSRPSRRPARPPPRPAPGPSRAVFILKKWREKQLSF